MSVAPSFSADIAQPFLAMLATQAGQAHLVAIHPNGISVQGKDCGTDADAALAWAQDRNDAGYNLYWTVNRVRAGINTKPKKDHIEAARFAHVDIDPPKSGGVFDKGEIVAAMEDIAAPPSFVIDSGGGLQAFWRFDGDAGNLAAIEAINVQIRDFFSADACQNIDRLMRLPGTVNWPNAKKRAQGRTPSFARVMAEDEGRTYEPGELQSAFPAAQPSLAIATPDIVVPEGVELRDADALGLSALDPLRSAIEHPPGLDRSGDALAAARLMAFSGHDDATIIGVLLNPANAVSAHCLSQRDARRAAIRCIQRVRADEPDAGAGHVYFDLDTIVANARARSPVIVPEGGTSTEVAERIWHVPAGVPAWRRGLTGGLAMFVEHVVGTARSPQPLITLGGALAMFGALAGRRYAGPTDLRTNLYCIGVADSGGGKDHPLNCVAQLLIQADLARVLGGNRLASGAGLVSALEREPASIFTIDEFGQFMRAVTDRSKAPKHLTEIVDTFTEFYSKARGIFLGTEYADKKERPRQVIEQPCLSLFGVSVPGPFWKSLSTGNVDDGSLARMIVFPSECEYPDVNHDIARTTFSDDLIAVVKAVRAGAEGHISFPLGDGPSSAPKPFTVHYADTQAAQRARDISEMQLAMLRDPDNMPYRSLIARLAENAGKVALVKAIADDPLAPKLYAEDLDWGLLIAQSSVGAITAAVREHVSDNEHEAKLKRVHRIIASSGSGGLDHEQVGRACQFMGSRRALNDALDFLIESGRVRLESMARTDGKTGRGKRVYFDID